MHVSHLSLHAFRSYDSLELSLDRGVTVLVGANGQGKTNIVEAVDYLSRLSSHRVAGDAALVKQGAEQAVVRASVVKEDREAVLEVEINPGRANRARVNRSALPRARDIVGLLRTVLFSPEDMALVKGEPHDRRRFLDDLLVLRTPRLAGVRADYDRVLRQRNALLKTATGRGGREEFFDSTLSVWDEQLVGFGSELTAARAGLVQALQPLVGEAYAAVAKDAERTDARVSYEPSIAVPEQHGWSKETLAEAFSEQLLERRTEEMRRAVTLVGPHRDELALSVGTMPAKGYASHGESWSFALALRLAAGNLLREDGDEPVLILDDVFAELDTLRRDRLADLVADSEQVLVTAAVPADVPGVLGGRQLRVHRGSVS
jgi:DNA replication and repair protein RecF